MTLQERIYEALADGPMSTRQLAAQLGAKQDVVGNILCVLRRKGITSPDGPASPKVKHYRIPDAPHPKSVRDPGPWIRAPKRKADPKPKPVVRPAIPCALAECWGWAPQR